MLIISAGGRLCQRWDSQSPHTHSHTPQAHPDAGLEENFCRNPDNKDRPWCYTTNPTLRWDYCNVMECADPTSLDYVGQECKGGYTCSKQIREKLCSCDDECSFFRECCENVAEDSFTRPITDDYHLWQCVPGFIDKPSYWLVGDCPDQWTDDVTRAQCLKKVDPFLPSDLIYRMPVKDDSRETPYRNIFCALCNNVTVTEVSIFTSRLMCSGQLNSSAQTPTQEYSTILSTLGVEYEEVEGCLGTGKLEFQLSDEFEFRDQERSCRFPDADYSNANCDITACRSYTYPFASRHKTYRNLHCALCDGLSLTATTHLRCASTVLKERGEDQKDHCFQTGTCPHEISLTRLFNFNAGKSVENNPCPSDTVYDPFVDTCRQSSSARTHGPNNETIPLQNCSKPALTFTSEEFQALPNGSVHLLSSNLTCPAEQVVILNTTASICGECVLQHFSNHSRGGQTINSWEANQGWLTLGLVIVSTVAVFGFVVHTVRSGQWKKVPEKLKVQMTTCMAAAEVMFVLRVLVPPGPGCTAFAILLHYLLLTAFTSMNALSMDLFLTFRDDLDRAKLYKYVLYTWMVPALVVVATVIVEFGSSVRVGYGESCWIGNPMGSLVAFGVPVFCALLVNVVLVTSALVAIRKSFEIANAAMSRSQSSKAWVYLRISFLMGLTWILGFIYPYVNSRVVEYIFIVLNASQGLLLTVTMTMTGDVLEKWKSAIRARFGFGEPQQDNGATATVGNQQTARRGTEATIGSATEIPRANLTHVEENRACFDLGDPQQDNGATATVGTKQTRGTVATIGSATEIPMANLAHVEENRACFDLGDPQQDNGETATVGTQQTARRETEETIGSATEMPRATLTHVEENRACFDLGDPQQDKGATATVGTQQTATRGTEATIGSATEIPRATLADVEENKARLPLTTPRQDNEETATASNRQTTTGGPEVTAAETGTATDIPTATLTDVEENKALLPLTKPRQDNETTATVSNRQTTAGGTEVTAAETGSATEIPTVTLTDVEENRARPPLTKPRQDNEETATASNRQTTAGGPEATAAETGSATEIPTVTLTDVEENKARLPLLETTATVSNRQTTAGKTEATEGGTDSATEMPKTTLGDVEEKRQDGDEN
ncbi:uncharacterized protein LOC144927396 [Branchiostoma floridae x Branchiostoma belcheri]